MTLDGFELYALAGIAAFAVVAAAWLGLRRSRATVPIAFLFVLIAGTRFRIRDPLAAVAGEADSQVILELALYGIVAFVVAVMLIARRSYRVPLGSLELLLGGYVLACAASVVWSLAPMLTLVRAFQQAVLLALGIAAVRVVGTADTVRSLMIAGAAYVLSCTALAFLVPGLHAPQIATRFSWFYVHPISAGSYAAITALMVIAAGLYGPARWRHRLLGLPLWVYPLPLIAILAMTDSRGPLFAFIGGAGVLVMKRMHARTAALLMSTALLVIVVAFGLTESIHSALVQAEAADNFLVRRLFRAQTADQVASFSGRAELWQNATGFLVQRPLTGYGYQGSRSVLLESASWAGGAHNAYLQTLMDLGALGALLLWPALVIVAVNGIPGVTRMRLWRWEECAVAALAVFFALNGITHESFAMGGYETLVLFAAVCVFSRLNATERAPQAITVGGRRGPPWSATSPAVAARLVPGRRS